MVYYLDHVGPDLTCKNNSCEAEIFFFSKRSKEIQNTYNSYIIVEMNNITYPDLKFTDRFIIQVSVASEVKLGKTEIEYETSAFLLS